MAIGPAAATAWVSARSGRRRCWAGPRGCAGVGPVRVGVGVGPVGVGVGPVGVGVGPVGVGVGPVGGAGRVGRSVGPVGVGPVGVGPVGVGQSVGPVGVGPVGVTVGPVGGAVVGGALHAGTVIVSLSRVTAPVWASARPTIVLFVVTVIDARARIVPLKLEPVPSVAELPTCQNTLQAWASPIRTTWLAEPVVSVEPIWKMKTAAGLPCASRYNVPLSSSADDSLYTPGFKVCPAPTKPLKLPVGLCPAAKLYAVVESDWACIATASSS